MKKSFILCVAIFGIWAGRLAAQQVEDIFYHSRSIVRDTNYDGYLFSRPFDTSEGQCFTTYFKSEVGKNIFVGCRYVVDTPVCVYGVAFTALGARPAYPYAVNDAYNPYLVNQWGMVVGKDGNTYVAIDSVKYHHYSKPVWYPNGPTSDDEGFELFTYPYFVFHYHEHDGVREWDRYLPLFELYFNTPLTLIDTFYVGLKKFPTTSDGENLAGIDVWSFFKRSNPAVPFEELLVLENMEESQQTGIEGCLAFNPNLAFFPIIKPYEEDSVFCDTVPNFHLVSMRMGYPTFAWDTDWFREEDLYQVKYAPYRTNDWITESTADSSIEIFSVFDPTIYYQARVRARRHHRCPIHDTVMWSDWSAPILFYTGATAPDTTLSLPQPLLKEGSPLFTLTPNPTTGEVTVTLGQPPLTLTHSSVSKADSSPNLGEQLRRLTLTIHDAAGNEVMRKVLVRQAHHESIFNYQFSIDLSAFPSGTYFVTLVTPTASGTQKLVVK